MADLRLFLDEHVVKHLDEALHSLFERQLAVSPEQLQIKVALRHLSFWKNGSLGLCEELGLSGHGLHELVGLGLGSFFLGLKIVLLLLPVNDIFLIKFNEDFLGELAPELREEVSSRQQLLIDLILGAQLVGGEGGHGHDVVVDYPNLCMESGVRFAWG